MADGNQHMKWLGCGRPGVGGKELMPVANELLSQMFQHPNWTHRHAALLAVSAMAEGCLAEMYEMLDSIVAYVPLIALP